MGEWWVGGWVGGWVDDEVQFNITVVQALHGHYQGFEALLRT